MCASLQNGNCWYASQLDSNVFLCSLEGVYCYIVVVLYATRYSGSAPGQAPEVALPQGRAVMSLVQEGGKVHARIAIATR